VGPASEEIAVKAGWKPTGPPVEPVSKELAVAPDRQNEDPKRFMMDLWARLENTRKQRPS
jgi:hypothetical protein